MLLGGKHWDSQWLICLGTGKTVADFTQVGMRACDGWSAHACLHLLRNPGSEAFLVFTDLCTSLTWCCCKVTAWALESGETERLTLSAVWGLKAPVASGWGDLPPSSFIPLSSSALAGLYRALQPDITVRAAVSEDSPELPCRPGFLAVVLLAQYLMQNRTDSVCSADVQICPKQCVQNSPVIMRGLSEVRLDSLQ